MRSPLKAGLVCLILGLSACSSQLDIPYKGVELNSLEQTANYFQARNVAKKITAMKIRIEEKPFCWAPTMFAMVLQHESLKTPTASS